MGHGCVEARVFDGDGCLVGKGVQDFQFAGRRLVGALEIDAQDAQGSFAPNEGQIDDCPEALLFSQGQQLGEMGIGLRVDHDQRLLLGQRARPVILAYLDVPRRGDVGRAQAAPHAQAQLGAVAAQLKDGRLVTTDDLDHRLDDGFQHARHVERRRNGRRDHGQHGQLGGALLHLSIQAGVFQGNTRLIGQRAQKFQVVAAVGQL